VAKNKFKMELNKKLKRKFTVNNSKNFIFELYPFD